MAVANVSHNPFTILNRTIIQRSTDFGSTWIKLDELDYQITSINSIPSTDESFIGVSGIFKELDPNVPFSGVSAYTKDGGSNWVVFYSTPYNAVEFISLEMGWQAEFHIMIMREIRVFLNGMDSR